MCVQLKVKATYKGVSTHVVYTLVNVTVQRNEFTPQFNRGDYTASLLEYFPLGNSILQVTATDRDDHVSKHFYPSWALYTPIRKLSILTTSFGSGRHIVLKTLEVFVFQLKKVLSLPA